MSLKVNKQEFLPTTFIYAAHHAAINLLDLVLEHGSQSTGSGPESLFAKSFQKTDPDQVPFLLKHKGAKRGLAT